MEQSVQALLKSDRAELADFQQIRKRIAVGERKIDAGAFVDYDEAAIGDLARDIHAGLERLKRR